MTLSSPISLMCDEHSELPTEEEFKKRAWKLKEEKGIKPTEALNELSNLYGYSCFNAIKSKLGKTMNISVDDIWKIICTDFKDKMQNHKGLEHFVINRAKFEGWVKVELSDSLSVIADSIVPEQENIDIVIDNQIAIELKTTNTSYKIKNVVSKSKNITDNIEKIIIDINALYSNNKYKIKLVVFIVFPLNNQKIKYWDIHMKKIKQSVNQFNYRMEEFQFNNKVPGRIYMVTV